MPFFTSQQLITCSSTPKYFIYMIYCFFFAAVCRIVRIVLKSAVNMKCFYFHTIFFIIFFYISLFLLLFKFFSHGIVGYVPSIYLVTFHTLYGIYLYINIYLSKSIQAWSKEVASRSNFWLLF